MFVNIDISTVVHPFLNRVCGKENFTKEMLYPFVDQYADTEVTDLLFNIFCNYSATPSQVWGTYEEKYRQTEENGHKVDYKSTFSCLHILNEEYGTDPFAVWIDRCKAKGIRPWLSFRMNDAHNNGDMPYSSRTAFFYEAKAKGWTLGSEYGYYGYGFDYGVAEIRQRLLSYIAEQLDRYDVDGIELDFLREIICFKYHTADMKKCIEIMNTFIGDVKKIIKQAENKKGSRILLAVRCMRDYEQSLRYGFDPALWDADILIPSPRWASSDSGIKVREWKKLCPKSKIIPCVETVLAVEPDRSGIMSAEVARGHIASFMAQGGDDFYLYNYFSDPDSPYAENASPKGHPYHRNTKLYSHPHAYPKRFAVVGQSSEYYPDTFAIRRPFPALDGEFEIVTGDVPSDKTVSLIIGVEGDIKDTRVSVNGVECQGFTPVDLTYIPGIGAQPDGYVNKETKCYMCNINAINPTVQKVSVSGSINVNWIELTLI